MQQPDALNQVADFHKTFKHPIVATPGIPSEDRCRLRVALIAEELKELEVAILEKDIVEVADALRLLMHCAIFNTCSQEQFWNSD
jgi:hypothetical protein